MVKSMLRNRISTWKLLTFEQEPPVGQLSQILLFIFLLSHPKQIFFYGSLINLHIFTFAA